MKNDLRRALASWLLGYDDTGLLLAKNATTEVVKTAVDKHYVADMTNGRYMITVEGMGFIEPYKPAHS